MRRAQWPRANPLHPPIHQVLGIFKRPCLRQIWGENSHFSRADAFAKMPFLKWRSIGIAMTSYATQLVRPACSWWQQSSAPVSRSIGIWRLPPHCRARRTVVLLAAVVLLSVIDLVFTINQMQTHGMAEGNPLVVHLARQTQSVVVISLYKMVTVILSVGVLFRLRRHAQAELAAWCALIILSGLSVQWVRYTGFMEALEPAILSQLHLVDPDWTKLG
jgi:hypothetical protein